MNLRTKAEVEELNRIRQQKIYRELLDKDTSLIFDDPLENDMVLNMGPQHPATHGVLRVLLRLDGENIIKAVPELGYLHRGFEKLAENLTYHEFIPHTDRLDYLSPLSNNVAIVLAIEKVFNVEVPERATWIRTLLCEMARISSHLMAMGATCLDAGALTALLWTFVEREKLYDLFELITGARFTTSHTRIGGVSFDINDDIIRRIREWVAQFPKELQKNEKLVHRNRIFVDRTAGIGILSAERCIQLGLNGPTLRGSGVKHDLRRDNPYMIYDKLDFNVITYNDCDCWSRYMVRVDEMKESTKLITQILDQMPSGPIRSNSPKTTLPKKESVYTSMESLINDFMLINFGGTPLVGESYTAIEAPKGELGFFIVSDGTGRPWKMKIHSPSASNLQGLPEMAEGSMIADVILVIGSIDPVMGEADK
ncbi:MAG: NADH dehydrogenase (quinone) subunit D [Candidatus Kapabacteria bacterium]|nr:NADH dehydrogenase (quinone) subunit D [Candidatus Kapabacteria bacterium]